MKGLGNARITANIINTGDMVINGPVTSFTGESPQPFPQPVPVDDRAAQPCDVGVITVTAKETHAVKRVLGLRAGREGLIPVYSGEVEGVSVCAVMAPAQGQRSAMAAVENLLHVCDPGAVVLCGIGGGRPPTALGDVVVATEVVYYDQRKITAEGVRRRADAHPAPAVARHAVNAFRTEVDLLTATDPDGRVRSFTVHDGPLGSGEAVIAAEGAAELAWLDQVNDKLLAIDMEAGGLARALHERTARTGRQQPWLVVRGISDHADAAKSDEPQRDAALHAALTLVRLLPYLKGLR
ncbi:hypothetical protein GCM10022221_71150 [Actinocorallia aurea]